MLTNVSEMVPLVSVVTAALLIPATAALVQVKVAPDVALVGVYEKAVLVQILVGVSVELRVGNTGLRTMLQLSIPKAWPFVLPPFPTRRHLK